jgi:hypothetical protein
MPQSDSLDTRHPLGSGWRVSRAACAARRRWAIPAIAATPAPAVGAEFYGPEIDPAIIGQAWETPEHTFTITGHPTVAGGRTAASIVAAIGADVITPGSAGGVDRGQLATLISALGIGESLELEPLGVIRGAHLARDTPRTSRPVVITRNR